jgi:hypothetical protein
MLRVRREEIERLYLFLVPFYFDWSFIYDSSFERLECHLGGNDEVFENVCEQVAWGTEGMPITCWLALQGDMEEVGYESSGKY